MYFKTSAALAHIQYDSFGNIIKNTKPSLPIPIGFAGGLVDHDTGLVRFGYRDYDPACGRFTCPDPLGDTGGDHDLYDYCVDDPVNSYDITGLLPDTFDILFDGAWNAFLPTPVRLFEAIKDVGIGITKPVMYGLALGVDAAHRRKTGKDDSPMWDALDTVYPKVQEISDISRFGKGLIKKPLKNKWNEIWSDGSEK